MNKLWRGNRGIAILAALTIGVTLLLAALALWSMVQSTFGNVTQQETDQRHYYAALAGLHHGMSELRVNTALDGTFQGQTGQEIVYEVLIVNNLSGTSPRTASDGTSVDPGTIYVRSSSGGKVISGQVSLGP